jgi:hypothetical protein
MDEQSAELNGDDGLLAEAMAAFEVDYDYWQPEYYRAENDIDFSLGNQWPENIRSTRIAEGRPCLTENRIDVSIIQVVNDIRQTRPAINVTPCDDKADVETAKVLKGIIRNIEQQSNANNAYDTSVEYSTRGGYGWIRVNTQYVSEDSFDQEARIEMIQNPFSVMIDSSIDTLDGSDARRAHVFTDIPKETFEKEYPDAAPLSFEPDLQQKNWRSRVDDTVRICEYFYKDVKNVTLYNTPLGPLNTEQCKEAGISTEGLASRESTKTSIKWCKHNGQEILEKTDWVGSYIPIVPVFGKTVWNEGRRKSFSLTYQGRDPQTRYNYEITSITERTALEPKAPWQAYDEQLTPAQAQMYAQSNIKNFPILYSKMTYDKAGNLLPKPERSMPPQGSPALVQQAMMSKEGIQATLGIFDASLGKQGNETSGKAILARQAEGDNATFHFVDNLATSIRQVGRILVDIIPKLYSGQTIARILGDDNEPRMVPLNQPVKKVGKEYIADPVGNLVIAPDTGKYDVSVSVGPSYATRRQEMTANMFELYKMAPQLLEVTGDIFFRNLDWDGAQELAERAKKVLPPEFQDESPEQAQLLQAQQQLQAMGQQLEQMDAKLKEKQDNQAESNALENKKIDLSHQIDAQKLEIEREKLALETLKAQGELNPEQVKLMMAAIFEMNTNLQDVGQAVDTILSGFEQDLGSVPMPPEGIANTNENVVI